MSDITPEEAVDLRKKLGIEVHTHPKTGALVTMGPVPASLSALLKELPPEPREFIEMFRHKFFISKAAKALGIRKMNHYFWLNESAFCETYAAAWKIVDKEVTDALIEANEDRAINGFREELYEVDENGVERLKSVKVKQDAAYLKMALMARKPEVYGANKSASAISIQILVVNE